MAQKTVNLPNGQTVTVNVPDGATDRQILRFVKREYEAGRIGQPDIDLTASPSGDLAQDRNAISPTPQAQQQDGQSLSWTDQAIGALENIRAMGGSIIAEPVAGLAGLGDLAAESLGLEGLEGTPADVVERVRGNISQPFAPKTETGIAQQQAIGEFLQPVSELMQAAQTGAGDYVFEKTGNPILASIATAGPDAVLSILGAAPVVKTARAYRTAAKQKIADLIKTAPQSKKAGKYMIDASGKIKKSKAFADAVSKGFDEATMASVKGSTRTDKLKMLRMVKNLEDGLEDARKAVLNRPADIVGDSTLERVKFIRSKNREAGRRLDKVAEKLKGSDVNYQPAVDEFLDDLNLIGVRMDNRNRPIFKGSDIEGAKGAEKFIAKVVKRMRDTKEPSAYDAHRLKRFIDEQVTYGKSKTGLAGRAEGIVKNLRRNIDGALDDKFPEYDRVNTQYADTIGALDSLQSGAGKVDLLGKNSDKAIGSSLRRLMGNAQSRVNLINALDELDSVSAKYGKKFDDDLITQTLFADELDAVFDLQKRTDLRTQSARGIRQATQGGRGLGEAAIDKAGELIDKATGIDDAKRIESLRNLLTEGVKK